MAIATIELPVIGSVQLIKAFKPSGNMILITNSSSVPCSVEFRDQATSASSFLNLSPFSSLPVNALETVTFDGVYLSSRIEAKTSLVVHDQVA